MAEFAHFKVAIIGGGIGGLAAALALQKAGINVTVFEKDKSIFERQQGYGLTLSYREKGPLADLGLLKQCIKLDCPSLFHWTFYENGKILGYFGRELKRKLQPVKVCDETNAAEVDFNRGNLRIPRKAMRMLLFKSLSDGTVLWNRKLTGIIENENEVVLRFGSEELSFDMVVGADGIYSHVRLFRDWRLSNYYRLPSSHLTPFCRNHLIEPLQYLGVTVIIGLSTCPREELIEKGAFYVVNGNARLFVMPYNNGCDYDALVSGDVSAKDDSERAASFITMWQLSFSGLSESDAWAFRNGCNDIFGDVNNGIKCEDEVPWKSKCMQCLDDTRCSKCLGRFYIDNSLAYVSKWQEISIVHRIISNTPPDDVWCTGPLYDRKEHMELWKMKPKNSDVIVDCNVIEDENMKEMLNSKNLFGSRVTVLGDAAHVMSMFKGQGANQAISDGPHLAKHISGFLRRIASKNSRTSNDADCSYNRLKYDRTSLITQINVYERELNHRSIPHVEASRQAAWFLHSVKRTCDSDTEDLCSENSVLDFDKDRYIMAGLDLYCPNGNEKKRPSVHNVLCKPFIHLACKEGVCSVPVGIFTCDCKICVFYKNIHCRRIITPLNGSNCALVDSVLESFINA